MTLRYLWVLALAGTCGVVPYGHAAESLRLEEAVARALQANPTLQAEAASPAGGPQPGQPRRPYPPPTS